MKATKEQIEEALTLLSAMVQVHGAVKISSATGIHRIQIGRYLKGYRVPDDKYCLIISSSLKDPDWESNWAKTRLSELESRKGSSLNSDRYIEREMFYLQAIAEGRVRSSPNPLTLPT